MKGFKNISYLDLDLSICPFTKRIIIKLYIKPTNTFSYVSTDSNHISHIFKNISISLFMIVRRICSLYSDYLFFSRIIFTQLLSRGYDHNLLCNIIHNIGKLDRDSLIQYKEKQNLNIFESKFIFTNTFELNFDNIKSILKNSLSITNLSLSKPFN